MTSDYWVRRGFQGAFDGSTNVSLVGTFAPDEFSVLSLDELETDLVFVHVGLAAGWDRFRDSASIASMARESCAPDTRRERPAPVFVAVSDGRPHPVLELRLLEVGFEHWCDRRDLHDVDSVHRCLEGLLLPALAPDEWVLRTWGMTRRSRPQLLLAAVERLDLIEEFARWSRNEHQLSRRTRITYREQLARIGGVGVPLDRRRGGPSEPTLPSWRELQTVIDLARGHPARA